MSQVCIVVPCFNEAARFDSAAFDAFLRATSEVSFILVDDGSADATLSVLDALADKHPARVRVLRLGQNRGKAEAVRQGMLLALADESLPFAGYWDADLATPLGAIELFLRTAQRQPEIDIFIGARVQLLGRRIVRRASRHYLGRIFATAASMVLALPVYDTQCGAKLLRNGPRARALFEKPFGSRWIFDVELLARHLRSRTGGASSVYELPLDRWEDIGSSKVKTSDFAHAVGEMAAIHRAYRLPGRWRFLLDVITHPFAQYVATGALGTSVQYLALIELVRSGRAAPPLASTLGAVLGALTNYLLTYHLTFAARRPHRDTLPRFFGVVALELLLNAAVMTYATARYPGHYLLAQMVSSALLLGVGFLVNRKWEFGGET